MDIETTKIYETAKSEIEQFYNVGTDKELLARYIAEDISLAVVEVYGKTDAAKYLLNAIANKVQSWCNPVFNDDEEEPDGMAEGLAYLREQLEQDEIDEIRAQIDRTYRYHMNPSDCVTNDAKVVDLLEEYGADNDLPEGWWENYGDIDDWMLWL